MCFRKLSSGDYLLISCKRAGPTQSTIRCLTGCVPGVKETGIVRLTIHRHLMTKRMRTVTPIFSICCQGLQREKIFLLSEKAHYIAAGVRELIMDVACSSVPLATNIRRHMYKSIQAGNFVVPLYIRKIFF